MESDYRQAFEVSMYIDHLLFKICKHYDNGTLTQETLDEFYENMSKYIFSIERHIPYVFKVNINDLDYLERHYIDSFDDKVLIIIKN